jgi:hypothetical protein
MIILKEEAFDIRYLTEGNGATKTYHIEGVFMQAEVKNKNRRMYPKHVLEREVTRYNRNYISENRAWGELGHPSSPVINLDRASIMIKELYPDGNAFIGKAKVLDTPYGKIIKTLLDEGGKLGVSSRGAGDLKDMGDYHLVQENFFLATPADVVADPSAPEAFVRGVMEQANWVYDNGIWHQQDLEAAKKELQKVKTTEIEATAIRLFENFLSKI